MGLLKTLHLKPKKGKDRRKSQDSALPVVRIEIVSDTVCPFCYLLYARLHTAMRQYEDQLDFQVHWIAYQLQPFAPPEGMRKQEYLELKFKDQADYLLQQKKKFFANEGMNLSLDGFVGNTFNSHRLVAYAATQSLEKADEVMGRLLEATHAEGKHVNDAQVLREIGRAAKLVDPDRVADDPDCCADEVSRQLDTMYKDVIGVPHMIINEGQIRIGGSKDVSYLLEVFQALVNESKAEREERQSSGSSKGRSQSLHTSSNEIHPAIPAEVKA